MTMTMLVMMTKDSRINRYTANYAFQHITILDKAKKGAGNNRRVQIMYAVNGTKEKRHAATSIHVIISVA